MNTLRIKTLEYMLRLETAVDDWFHRLTKREQQAYVRAHPRSKFAKSPGTESTRPVNPAWSIKPGTSRRAERVADVLMKSRSRAIRDHHDAGRTGTARQAANGMHRLARAIHSGNHANAVRHYETLKRDGHALPDAVHEHMRGVKIEHRARMRRMGKKYAMTPRPSKSVPVATKKPVLR